MKDTYRYDEENNIVIVCHNPIPDFIYGNTAIRDFCEDHNIRLEEFNSPVIIEDFVKNCEKLFSGCAGFNQKVAIPDGVKDCDHMFSGCARFNQKVVIPDGVEDCGDMFKDCESFNQPIELPESIKATIGMFENCKSFNQTVKTPNGVINSACMFRGCETLNQPITLSNRLVTCDMMFEGCKSFNQKVTLPETLRVCGRMFKGCTSFNQPITIGENVNNCGWMFVDCTALNQPVQVLRTNCFCTDMFKNCVSLLPENVTLYCRRMIRKNLEKKLQNVWGTEEIMDKTNIVTVKTKKTAKISGIRCILEGNRSLKITSEEIGKLTLQEIHQKLEELYDQGELSGLEIREESEESERTLSIYFDELIFCIGIVDAWSGTCHYYNSGEGKEPVVIRGDYYPKHMVSDDKELLFLIIDEFLKNGKPTRKVKWIKD